MRIELIHDTAKVPCNGFEDRVEHQLLYASIFCTN